MAEIIYAEIRAQRDIVVNGCRLAKGQALAQVRLPDERLFRHLRARLGWSAFAVVQIEGKPVAKELVAGAAGIAASDVARLDQLEAELAQAKAVAKSLHRRLYELSRRSRPAAPAGDVPVGLGALTALGSLAQLLPEYGIQTVQDLAAADPADLERLDLPGVRGRGAELIALAVAHLTPPPHPLAGIAALDDAQRAALTAAGIASVEQLAAASPAELVKLGIPGLGAATAEKAIFEAKGPSAPASTAT